MSIHFDDELKTPIGTESKVTFPSIQLGSAQTTRNASVTMKADQERARLEKMKFYATYIRKINEDDIFKKKSKISTDLTVVQQPSHVKKYNKYMQLLD